MRALESIWSQKVLSHYIISKKKSKYTRDPSSNFIIFTANLSRLQGSHRNSHRLRSGMTDTHLDILHPRTIRPYFRVAVELDTQFSLHHPYKRR